MSDFLCPLNALAVQHGYDFHEDAPDGEYVYGPAVRCDAVLHLVYTLDWPIDGDAPNPWIVGREQIGEYAYSSSWAVMCEEGHTVATQSLSADENAEPFSVHEVMRAIGAKQS